MTNYLLSVLSVFLLLFTGCKPVTDPALIGAKIYEHSGPYDQLFERWNQMGINTAFSSESLISTEEFMLEAREHRISTFVIFPVFFNPEAIVREAGLAAINRNGEAAAEEWLEFVCPSRQDYRMEVVEHARRIIRDHRPDGISIDFIRHFVYWEKVYPGRDPASLPVSCFDSACLEHFQAETGISIPARLSSIPEKADWILDRHQEEWTTWRCGLISSMAEAIARAAREEKPDILVNIHLVPWGKGDFDRAIRNVAGQDIRTLSSFSDFLSPMTYAHMVKQSPSWVHGIVEDMFMQTGAKILPSIQVGQAYLDTEFDLEEFRETMEAALLPPSTGVVIWSWDHLIAEPEKADLFKDIVKAN